MPIALPNTTVADTYPIFGSGGAQVAGTDVFSSGWFTVANNAADCEYSYGIQGQYNTGPEIYLAPGTYPLTGSPTLPINGIRFKNHVAGSAAQVWGAFFYKNDPVIQSSNEFTSQVSPSGGVSPTPNIVHYQSILGADISMPSPTVFVTAVQIVIPNPGGIFLVNGTMTAFDNTASTATYRIWDGTTVYASGMQSTPARAFYSLSTIITLTTGATLQFQLSQSVVSGALIKSATDINNQGNNATQMNAIQLG